MLVCPNINTPEWKALEKSVGRFEATKDFMEHEGDIRTPEQVKQKLYSEGRLQSETPRYSKPDIGDPAILKKDAAEQKLDSKPTPQRETPKNELTQFKKLISLSSKQVSGNKRAAINSKIKGANGQLGTSYYVKFTPVGQSDLWTWEILDYAQKTTSYFRDDQPTGSLVEQAGEEMDKPPLTQATNDKTRAIEIASKMAQALSNQVGVNYQVVTPAEAIELTKNAKNPWKAGDIAFYIGNIVYFVGNNLRPDVVLHEFSHPLLRAIAISNSKLFNSFYEKFRSTSEGQTIIDEVKALYPDLEPTTDLFKEECLIRGLVHASDLDGKNIKQPVGFAKFIKDLLFAFKQLLRKVFGQKVDVAKLSSSTTLDDLASMLMKGDKFNIATETVSEQDTVAYMKDQTAYINDIMKVSRPELMALTTRVFDIASKHIEIVQNNKNYAEMLHILADEYDRGDLNEMRANLSKYANNLSNRLNKVKDEVEFNRNHAAAMVNTLFRLEGMVKKIHTHMEDLSTDTDNVDNLQKAFYYDYLLKYWGSFIDEAKDALNNEKIVSDSPMYQLVNSIATNLEKSKVLTNKMYSAGAKDILYDELLPMGKKIEEKYKTIIANLKARNAPQSVIDKWYKEYHGLSETDQKRLEDLETAKVEGRPIPRAEYDRLKQESFKGAKLTPEKLDKTLRGELGDANAFSSFFEGYLYNPDIIVGGFALYVKNHMTDVLNKAQAKFNFFATDMKSALEAAGYNPTNVGELASKITHVQSVGIRDEDNNLVERKVLTFMGPHQNYRYAVDKDGKAIGIDQARHAVDVAQRQYSLTGTKEDEKSLIDSISAMKELERNFFHQKYRSSYYKLEGLLERDDIGKKAAYLRDNIFERMKELTNPLETEMDVMNASDKIDLLWSEYRQLNSRFGLDGKLKTGDDLEIANRLREYKDASREFYEWKERKGVFQNSLKTYEQELVDKGYLPDSREFRLYRKEWINRNTRIVIKPEFFLRRKVILDRIAEIMSRIPDADEKKANMEPLYRSILDISYTFRDDDGQPNGQAMSEQSIAEVKALEEKIIQMKKNFAGFNGLTEDESERLNEYFSIIKASETKLAQDELMDMRELLDKQGSGGLDSLTKAELIRRFVELDEMQQKEATDYYVDSINYWLQKLDNEKLKALKGIGIINKVTADYVLTDYIINDLLEQNEEFRDWFMDNHIRKMKWSPLTKKKKQYWERIYIWNIVRPTDSLDYESTDIKDAAGNVIETIPSIPSTKYFVRRVKDSFRTERIIDDTVDNKGQWLPRLDVKDSPYVNQEYLKLKNEDPKLFNVLDKMTKHHLSYQEGLGYKSRLYLDVPRFRKNSLEILQQQQLKRTLKGAVEGKLPMLTTLVQRIKLFFQRSADPQEQGLNPGLDKEDFMLVRADMFDNEISNIPIAGLYDIDITDVSTNLTHSMMRYMLSAERQKKLIEINPVARALQSALPDKVKDIQKINHFNMVNRGLITYIDKRGKSVRKMAVNNFIEREFEGQTNTGMLTDTPWLNNTAKLIFGRASFGFFALNIPSALKNTLSAKFQGMIEAAAGKYMDMKSFTKGERWAFNTMGAVSFEIYKNKPKSLNIQITEVFDAIQGRFEEKFGEAMSRTLASDTVNMSWLYNFRKWTESQATLQTFAGIMYHSKVMQNGKEISYMDAWEVRDGQIRIKDGIDVRYSNIPIDYTIQEGDTYKSLAAKFSIPEEELKTIIKDIKSGKEISINNNMFKAKKNEIQQVINSLNGAYASFDQPEAQRYLAFRFVSFLRRYFTAMAVKRWGFSGSTGSARGRMNPGLGDIHEGYYVTVMKTLKRMVTTDSKYLAFMTPDEKRAWIKITVELLSLMAISMLLVPLLGWDEDDKDKYEKLRARSGAMPFMGLTANDPNHPFEGAGFLENHLLSLAMQVRSENETFLPWPNYGLDDYTALLDLKSLATGPTLKAYKQMFTVGLDQLTGDPSAYYKRAIGPYEWQQEGGPKLINYTMKALGLTGSAVDPVTAIKNAQSVIVRGK